MASSKDAVSSDTEGQEKPVREQLKKASLERASGEHARDAAKSQQGEEDATEAVAPEPTEPNGDEARAGRELRKKRSFDEIEGEPAQGVASGHTRTQHSRKRSRDSTAEEHDLNNGRKISDERKRDAMDTETTVESNGKPKAPAAVRPGTPEGTDEIKGLNQAEALASPKTKRSRLRSSSTEDKETATTEVEDVPKESLEPVTELTNKSADLEQTTESEKASETKSPVPIPPSSGFGNSSVTSPFASVRASKSPPPEPAQTSASAFAASGFSSLAGASSSGFGSLAPNSGGFKDLKIRGGSQNSSDKPDAPAKSAFGGTLGQQSAFGGSGGSAFGGGGGDSTFGGGFGSKLGGSSSVFGGSAFGGTGSGLSKFGSGKVGSFGSSNPKPAKAFGAPADEDDEKEGDDDDESGFKSPISQDEDKKDERFYAQDLETGEEDEITTYQCRAKLYNFVVVGPEKADKAWKERGLGTVKLNLRKGGWEEEEKVKPKARLLMRAEGSHRVVLNTPVKKEIQFGAPGGGKPTGGILCFMGTVEGKTSLELLQLKVRPQYAQELHDKIAELQEEM